MVIRMVRRLDRDSIKAVIAKLRKGPKTWKDLKTTELPDKSLQRILKDYLHYWGLVTKTKDGKWAWYEHVKTFESAEEYRMLQKHSRDLIPGIRALIYEVEKFGSPLSRMTREGFVEDTCGVKLDPRVLDKLKAHLTEHLRIGYDGLYNKIKKLRSLKDACGKEDRSLKKHIVEELREPVHIPVHPSAKKTFEYYDVSSKGITFSVGDRYRNVGSVVGDLVTRMKTPLLKTPELNYDKEKKDLDWGGTILARGVLEGEVEEIKGVIKKILTEKRLIEKANKLKKYEKKVRKLQAEIGDKLREIEAGIRVGDVLDGTCSVCRTLELSKDS